MFDADTHMLGADAESAEKIKDEIEPPRHQDAQIESPARGKDSPLAPPLIDEDTLFPPA